jgi:phytoene synthase
MVNVVGGRALRRVRSYGSAMVDPANLPNPERALALSYAPASTRPGLEALFALDTALGTILKTTREPIVGQMRLTWWYEALGRTPCRAAGRRRHGRDDRRGLGGAA